MKRLLIAKAICAIVAPGFAGPDILPAGKVIGKGYSPALGIVGRGTGVAVFQNVNENFGAAVVAVKPKAYALVTGPVLGNPGVDCIILEAVNNASVGSYIDIDL